MCPVCNRADSVACCLFSFVMCSRVLDKGEKIWPNDLNFHCRFCADIPHTDSYTGIGGSGRDKSQTHTLTKFPRSNESDDEDKADVRFACYCIVFILLV